VSTPESASLILAICIYYNVIGNAGWALFRTSSSSLIGRIIELSEEEAD